MWPRTSEQVLSNGLGAPFWLSGRTQGRRHLPGEHVLHPSLPRRTNNLLLLIRSVLALKTTSARYQQHRVSLCPYLDVLHKRRFDPKYVPASQSLLFNFFSFSLQLRLPKKITQVLYFGRLFSDLIGRPLSAVACPSFLSSEESLVRPASALPWALYRAPRP